MPERQEQMPGESRRMQITPGAAGAAAAREQLSCHGATEIPPNPRGHDTPHQPGAKGTLTPSGTAASPAPGELEEAGSAGCLAGTCQGGTPAFARMPWRNHLREQPSCSAARIRTSQTGSNQPLAMGLPCPPGKAALAKPPRQSHCTCFGYSLGQIRASLAVMLLLQAKHMVMPETVMVVKRWPLV